MGAKKTIVKGLALGAVVAGVAALIKAHKEKDQKMMELEDAGVRIKEKVVKHAKKLGKLSKSSFANIVDTTVAEYRGMKALSQDDLKDLGKELKASWADVQELLMSAMDEAKAKAAAPAKKKAIKKRG